jgi:pimeloyl-ACP methyl ester carboxylesterase
MMEPDRFDLPPPPRTVRLANGRTVGYYEFGAPNGTPVLAMHGTPASGAGFSWADGRARARGVRLVAPDRPGVGRTDRPARGHAYRIGDYPPELAATADALGIEQFGVLGYSGGGPYALAVTHALPTRVVATAVVAGSGQMGAWATIKDFAPTDRRMTRLSVHMPSVARAALAISARGCRLFPRTSALLANMELSPTDRAVMRKFASARAALALFTRATERTSFGALVDYAAAAYPWDFDVESIAVPLRAWHATDDPLVPIRHSEALVARVPGAELVRWPGEGHLAVIDRVGEVLDWLAATTATEMGRSDHAAP